MNAEGRSIAQKKAAANAIRDGQIND